jgi:hypothetical protein
LVESKSLLCVFRDRICEYHKSEKVLMMVRCWRCQEFKRFLREMEKDDARMMNDIEKEREGDG